MKAIKKLIFCCTLHNNQGFAIIAALLAMLILTAVGALVFTITTKDIRVATRVVGEKKASSAAQSGIHETLKYFNRPEGFDVEDQTEPVKQFTTTSTMVDLGVDPYNNYYSYSKYSVSNPPEGQLALLKLDNVPYQRAIPGYDNTESVEGFKAKIIIKSIEGAQPLYKSRTVVDVGIGVIVTSVSTNY